MDCIKELMKIVSQADHRKKVNGRKTVLFVDEIHRWNKAHQDALLPHLESGVLTLIGATTENPYYALVNPLLSRSQLFELYPLTVKNVKQKLVRAIADQTREIRYLVLDVKDDPMK